MNGKEEVQERHHTRRSNLKPPNPAVDATQFATTKDDLHTFDDWRNTIHPYLHAPERYIGTGHDSTKEWYLGPTYGRDETLINPDGGIIAGTLQAMVELLTTHDHRDPSFIKTFLSTYKSFTNLDQLFNLLLARFNIQSPEGLYPFELEEWIRLKRTPVRSRVIAAFQTMVTDGEVLEKDDYSILERMKDFLLTTDAAELPASKRLFDLIERAQAGRDPNVKMTPVSSQIPPRTIPPKVSWFRKLQFLDIDGLEMAKQLTILESRLYNKVRTIECLLRARESNKGGEHRDHIHDVIQMTNKISYWVTNTILSRKDPRNRATVFEHFVSVANHCRILNNFSSMFAIIGGLNSPPIRRLTRTWDNVDSECMPDLEPCEALLRSYQKFSNYRSTLAKVSPPCVPFIGVYLTDLTVIQHDIKDHLQPNMISFKNCQGIAEVLREIKHWQSAQFNLRPLPVVLRFIEESLAVFSDGTNWDDYFWNASLEREPT
ncbi:ras GEF [Rickenella mellea]|uniref:Ras GEF n=1 Tax=Rickenella mellea TaxID=50990 RepID=A0A4Y7PM49_9AGAM|nr:ras GEF [Rickenella mellea]